MASSTVSHLRKKPSTRGAGPSSRDSNMVRASVLDAAMQLGFGDPNSTVASWMFNNPVTEEEEEEVSPVFPSCFPIPEPRAFQAATPDLATSVGSHSNSPSTSNSHSHNQSFPYTPKPGAGPNIYRDHFPFPVDSSSSSPDVSIAFPSANSPSQVIPRSKLGHEDENDRLTSNSKKDAKEDKGEAKARKRTESKAAKERERDEKKARKEEEKARKREAKKGKLFRKQSGEVTEYETDGAVSDGAYVSEASGNARPRTKSLTTKWSRNKPIKSQAKSDTEGPPTATSSGFFRRKSKPTKPANVVPPLPTRAFTTPLAPPSHSGPLLSVPNDALFTSAPLSAASNASSWVTVATTPSDLAPLPPIAARFASKEPSPISPSPSSVPPVPTTRPSTAQSAASEADSQTSVRLRPKAVPVRPPPAPINDPEHEEGDGTTSSRSSEISMPASLPTSISSPSASSHYKQPLQQIHSPTPPSSSRGKNNRPGLFGFGSSGSISTDKRKLDISLPLTRGPDTVAGSSTGPSAMPVQPVSNGNGNQGEIPLMRKPTLEVKTQYAPRELSILSPPSVYPSSASPAPLSTSSYAMVTPATSSEPHHHHPFAAVAASSNSPVPPLKVQPKKSRTAMVITHPHTYTGAEADSSKSELLILPPPRRMSHNPVPPPTPPPTGPLPRVPPPDADDKLKAPSQLNPRAPSPSGKRGKDLPFGVGRGQGVDRDRVGKLDGYEERMKVPRYRDLYAAGRRAEGSSARPPAPPRTRSYEKNPFPMVYTDDEASGEEEADSDRPVSPVDVQKEMNRIRGKFNVDERERFSAASVPVTEPGDRYNDSIAEDSMVAPHKSFEYEQLNSFSFSAAPRASGSGQQEHKEITEEAENAEDEEEPEMYSPVHVELNDDVDDDDKSFYGEEDQTAGRRTMYGLEGRDAGDTESHYWDDGRISRYSAAPSMYSVLDGEQSEEARQRFLKKVAAMYGEGADVPPMPTLTASYSESNVIKEPGVGRRRF